MKKTKTNHTSLSFTTLDARDVPQLIDRKNTQNYGQYIRYGEDNSFPDYLSSLYQQSAQMNAIVTTITDFVCGESISFSNEMLVKLRANKRSELTSIFNKCAFDLALFNGFAIKCIFNRLKEIARLEYVDYRCIRVATDETTLLYADTWSQGRRGALQAFSRFEDFICGEDENNPFECIYYYTGNTRGIYPVPSYIGSLRAIETSVQIDRFHLSSIQNNLSSSAIINIIGDNYTDEEKMTIERSFRDNFCGSENASQFMLAFNDSPENKVTVERLSDDGYDAKYQALAKSTRDNIFAGFRINPIICGMQPDNGGFSKDEYLQASSLFNVTVIRPLQKKLVGAFNDMLGLDETISIEAFNFDEETLNEEKEISKDNE